MTVSIKESAFVTGGGTVLNLSDMINVTNTSNNPTYLYVTVYDRNEYTVGATGQTATISGNGQSISSTLNSGGDKSCGLYFKYDATTNQYVCLGAEAGNQQGGVAANFGNLSQMKITTSGSLNDMTNISIFGSNTAIGLGPNDAISAAATYPANYLGSVTIANQAGITVPAQATPNSICSIAKTFVGQVWNDHGCWVLASTIAAEAGASLPLSTSAGMPGLANGEWFVAFNGSAGQAAPAAGWQSLVKAGDVVGIPGHVTTVVAGSGSTAQLVDNARIGATNNANDGSPYDVIIHSAFNASAEFTGVSASGVVIYRLDCPAVTATTPTGKISATALSALFSATDPNNTSIVAYQVYTSVSADKITYGGKIYTGDNSAATALTCTSLTGVTLACGATGSDTIDVRAENSLGYWGDWQTETIAANGAGAATIAVTQTAAQTWKAGTPVSFTLPANTFVDSAGAAVTYSVTLANGAALPSWLTFNSKTGVFTGTPPTAQSLAFIVTATDATNGVSASETFNASVLGSPTVANQTAAQTWLNGHQVSLVLPAATFNDPNGQALTYKATLSNGAALPSWLTFNAATDTFSGTPSITSPTTLALKVTATDTSGLSVSETFNASLIANPTFSQTATQIISEGKAATITLPANTFVDPNGQHLTYAATLANGQALPSWLTFNSTTDTFTGTSPIGAANLLVKVTATDTSGLSASETFGININHAPTLTAQTPAETFTQGKPATYTLPAHTFTDPQGLTMTYSATQANGAVLPSWLTINSTTGAISGNVVAGTKPFDISVIATDAVGLKVAETVHINTILAPTDVAFKSQSLSDAAIINTSLANAFTDPNGQALTYSATLANGQALPSWLALNHATGVLTGTVAVSNQTVSLNVTATDTSGLSVSDTLNIVIPKSGPLNSDPTPVQHWNSGQTVVLTLPADTFRDPQGYGYTLSAHQTNGQALPSWIHFDALHGALYGTVPTTVNNTAFSLEVDATNTAGLVGSDYITAVVGQANYIQITGITQHSVSSFI